MSSFKICPYCKQTWHNRDAFLRDDTIALIGYQADFNSPRLGILMFNHTCKGTLALPVQCFEDLYIGPVYQENLKGSEDCPGYCLKQDCLDPCPNRCACAFVRQIMSLLQRRETKVKEQAEG